MKSILYFLLFIPVYGLAASAAKLTTAGPHPDAPEQLMEYGQLVGNWQCTGQSLQQDGTWKDSPGVATWTWYYVLDGHAIQDFWHPAPNVEGKVIPGLSLRTYDAATGIWNVIATLASSARIDAFNSSFRNDAIHVTTERAASARFPAHLMHITFHNISANHFDWKYEGSGLTDGQNWQEFSRISCDRNAESSDPVATR